MQTESPTIRSRARSRGARVLLWSISLASAACGVHEYLHGRELVDPSDDFAPATDLGSSTGKPRNPPRVALPSAMDADAAMSADDDAGSEPDAEVAEPVADAAVDAGPSAGESEPPAPAPAPEPTTITLGGSALRKSDVIAFFHFGHSNMAGRATEPMDDRDYFFTDTDPQAWMYHVGTMPELAKEPYTAGDMKSFNGTLAGPGTALLKLAIERAPDKYFMSLGFGQSGATCMQYLPGGLYYESATQAAFAIKDRVTIGAIILMLGISETNAPPETRSDFASCVSQLIDALRKALAQPNLPVLLSDYERGATGVYAPDAEFGRTIIEQIAMVPELVPNCVIIPTDEIEMQDDHHFNLAGHKQWSRRVLDLMQMHGWFPWGEAAPTP